MGRVLQPAQVTPALPQSNNRRAARCYGFGFQELSLPFEDGQEAADVAEELLDHFPADEYPSLFKMITDHVLQPGCDCAAEFEIGLDPILDGFARLRATN